MLPRRSWPARAPPCAASIERHALMPVDPLDTLCLPIIPVEPRPEFTEALLRRMQAVDQPVRSSTLTIRYFVTDMDAAVDFYCQLLGFEEELRPALCSPCCIEAT